MADAPHLYAAVALNVPLDKLFHYRVPEALRGLVTVGARVRVPFGRREMTGTCVKFSDDPGIHSARVRDIIGVLDKRAFLDERMLDLTEWMARYYCCSWGKTLDAVLPSVIKKDAVARTIQFVSAVRSPEELLAHAAKIEKRAPRQARILRALAEKAGEIAAGELAADAGVLSKLSKAGFLTLRREKAARDPFLEFPVERAEPLVPTPEQQVALDRIQGAFALGRFHVALLHGVTGSGKTEVYLRALRLCIESGRQGIVLVPEIALTPQTVARFRARFDRVSVLHGDMTDSDRREHWTAIHEGRADVVVGTRSAVFAPVPKLGLLVVDEEHDASFKQPNAPRYHARDVGIWRARQESALVILGSATPSFESLYNAQSGKYELLTLPRRVEGRPLPPVEILDLKSELSKKGRPPRISRRLCLAMKSALERGEQVILFLNRRGFNTYISCPRCEFVLRCAHCDVSLVYHSDTGVARCHYCAYKTPPPAACPACGLPGIKLLHGSGTERVEEEIARLFGAESVARMDTDSMQARGSHEKVLEAFRAGKTRILLGTQMVVKGLDFPNVTLVGVIDADTSIHMWDFRARERTFQFLTQVAGRTGRGPKGGRVIVQTLEPNEPCIRAAAKHDYDAFARRELEERKRYGLPPFTRMARLVFRGRDARKTQECCTEVVAALRSRVDEKAIKVLGPVEAPVPRINKLFRWHAQITAPDPEALRKALSGLDRRIEGVEVIVDVDPVSMQ
jgi:primosomal protein N' (replication factor Y) (superfamily II helicase)